MVIRTQLAVLFLGATLLAASAMAQPPAAKLAQGTTVDFLLLEGHPGLLPGGDTFGGKFHVLRFAVEQGGPVPGFEAKLTTSLDLPRRHENLPEDWRPGGNLKKMFPSIAPEDAETCIGAAVGYGMVGRDDTMGTLLEKMHARNKRDFGEKHFATAASLNNLAVAACWKGQHDAALRLAAQAIEILDKHFPPDKTRHWSYFAVQCNRAAILGAKGDLEASAFAWGELREAFRKRELPPIQSLVILVTSSLGQVQAAMSQEGAPLRGAGYLTPRDAMELQALYALRAQGQADLPLAAIHFQAAVEIFEGMPPDQQAEHHKLHLVHLHNLTAILLQLEDHRWAQWSGERILALAGPSPRLLEQLGIARREQGDFRGAAQHFDRAIQLLELEFPPAKHPRGHERIIEGLNDLAGVQRQQGLFRQSAKTCERALRMCQEYFQKEAVQPAQEPWIEAHILYAAALLALNEKDRARAHCLEGRKAFEATKRPVAPKRVWATQRLMTRLGDELAFFDQAGENLKPSDDKFPRGWPDLPMMDDLGSSTFRAAGNWGRAAYYQRRALTLLREYYPPEEHPRGHTRIVESLGDLGSLEALRGESQQARKLFEEALAMAKQCAAEQGAHATALEDLARHLMVAGDPEPALGYVTAALAIRRRLAAKDNAYDGHLEVAEDLADLAQILSLTDSKAALVELEKASQILKAALPIAKQRTGANNKLAGEEGKRNVLISPLIHVQTATARVHLAQGNALLQQGDIPLACAHLAACASLRNDLHPRKLYPQGHPDLARALHQIGVGTLHYQKLDVAVESFETAERVWLLLYPPDKFPQGNVELAATLEQLALARLVQGKAEQSLAALQRAARMRRQYADLVLPSLAEAEALNFCAVHLPPPHELLSCPAGKGLSDDELYDQVWFRRGQVRRTLAARRELLGEMRATELATDYGKYQEVRSALATALLTGKADAGTHLEELRTLTAQKESLERRLAASVPKFRQRILETPTPTQLAERLSGDAVFVDFVRYRRFDASHEIEKWNDRWQPHYVAFLVAPRSKVERIDLGPATPIDQAVRAWREAIRGQAAGDVGRAVRDLLWAKIESRLPAAAQVVYLAPDGALSGIPWGAIPGAQPHSLVLARYAIATVPSGQFLLEAGGALPRGEPNESVLAVGALDYDASLAAAQAPLSLAPALPPPEGGKRLKWRALAGTKQELASLAALAGTRAVRTITERDATLARVLGELDQVETAHFATHGFFADAEFRSALQVDERAFAPALGQGIRVSAAGRNPLVLSGLVLSGANPSQAAAAPEASRSLLTGESIASLHLPRLKLVVLSACETGLGDVAGGEGVLGLQRAFQVAGAKNVVASLWKVDDAATQALMTEFYANLWQKKMPPIEALRQAQLTMIADYSPTKREFLRAGGFEVRPFNDNAIPKLNPGETRLPPFYWAAFVLSGAGK